MYEKEKEGGGQAYKNKSKLPSCHIAKWLSPYGKKKKKNISRSQCYRPCSLIIFILKARTFSSIKSSHFSVLVINDYEIVVQVEGHVALFICVCGSRNRNQALLNESVLPLSFLSVPDPYIYTEIIYNVSWCCHLFLFQSPWSLASWSLRSLIKHLSLMQSRKTECNC